MRGAQPWIEDRSGERSEREAASWIRAMFGRVAHRYDLANHVLSFGIDYYWRAHTAKRLRHILVRPEARVLDVCCGTGDLMLALERERPRQGSCGVLGSDFCHPMLVSAHSKAEENGRAVRSALFEADALRLPLADASIDLLTAAFGFRNLANYRTGLAEMRRVLRPGGTLAILEFSQPPNRAFAALYNFYSRRILPMIGGFLSGDRGAYTYLPESVKRFPDAASLAAEMSRAGFPRTDYEYLTGGIVALHLGWD
ncbi:MAG: bifunctional demethylmenaquinone methyltransferase/2-methoxy-6-polyprenyl-1,4-benzoquinol methylase UbiE [Acidobacteriia bacterium]|nr:bifunctional demethylmenaquinone methyltransferase/2-methoxy-6-polyprenyl-1,4-benzoquinol methylase UbiE [Terriglobia bacterium]MBV8906315.1 bifunctional demethylmenaquinone methyltransferase/2-methoxy-6-polyprenyl-1,4-benzoquinol methylase UbiE [Terriglobia bacterium]